MSWFKRKVKGILTPTEKKKDVPKGLWYKTPKGKVIRTKDLEENDFVSPVDNYHIPIGSAEYFKILFDDNKYKELFTNITSNDPLNFKDTKTYKQRLKVTQNKTNLDDAIRVAKGQMNHIEIVVAAMDFSFIGGSMGSVVGEKISKAVDSCIKHRSPLLIISKSGGARMMEGSYSLMQMAKTSAKINLLHHNKIPYISLLTNPTTGGVTASFAMLGDFVIAEPDALIGFAGPRVIKETMGKELPKGFQKSEFVLKSGFIDFIVDRRELKEKISTLLRLL